jgi:hypothetical protein
MTATLSCEALREDIISLLYDDGDAAERSRARDHLAQCVPCRIEYTDLKGVRKTLTTWSLPAAEPVAQPRKTAPRWVSAGLAAAAGLVIGIGATTVGRNVLFLTASETAVAANPATQTSTPATAPATSASAQFVSYDQLQSALKDQENRYLAEIADLRRTLVQNTGAPAQLARGGSDALAIERLLKASEERQARALEARLVGLRNENELQRQYDMAQVAAGLAYIDSRTGADAARTSELMKNLVRVTAKPQDR